MTFDPWAGPSWKLPRERKSWNAERIWRYCCHARGRLEIHGAMRRPLTTAIALCLPLALAWPALAGAAEIKVLSDGPLRSALTKITEQFQRQTEHRVHLSFGAAPALKTRMAEGETAEILIMPAPDAEELTKQRKLNPDGQIAVARIGIGLAIREGVPVPEIATVDALKETLLRADSLVFTTLASGNHFLKVAERLGIADDVKSKSTQLPSGAAVFDEVLKRNGRDIGIGSIVQIMDYGPKGLRLVGPLPEEVQSLTVFVAGVLAGAKTPDAAKEFIRYLDTPESRAAFVEAGAS